MNRRRFLAVLLPILLTIAGSGRAQDIEYWTITRFETQLEIEPDAGVEVTETIDAVFRSPKHGIYREIPIRYDVGLHQYALRFRLLNVDDGDGHALTKEVTYQDNRVRIRIGDADKTLTGRQTYRIHYRVDRAVLWEGEHAVLRWNATGTEWRVPIEKAVVVVTLPKPLPENQIDADAWTGPFGDRGKDFSMTRPDDRTVRFETGPFRPSDGITVDVAMPAETVAEPGFLTRLGWWLGDNFVYAIFPASLALCLGYWYSRGRDEPGMGSIVVQYEAPDGMDPAEVGTLIDERVDMRDISATIIDLAVRGFIRIEEEKSGIWIFTGNDYRFTRLRDGDGLKPHELKIVEKLFDAGDSVLLSSLRTKFYGVIPKVRRDLYQGLTHQGYFDGNPDSVRTGFLVLGAILLVVALAVALLIQRVWIGRVFVVPAAITGVLSFVAIVFTSRVMPRKTRKGRIAWERVSGLEEYIRRAEVEDLREQEKRNIFERLLPYAIAFNLADRWAKSFEGLYREPPDWYRPADGGAFSTYLLASSINRSVSAMNASLPSQPRSSGSSGGWSSGGFSGGSSGGGFGGGGGGSW